MSESIEIGASDVPLCRLALALLDKALKQAEKIGAMLDLPPSPLQHLRAGHESLVEIFRAGTIADVIDAVASAMTAQSKNATVTATLSVPGHLRRPLRLGVAIEFERVTALGEAQEDLLVPAEAITRTRLRQLEGLLAVLDDQLSLVAG